MLACISHNLGREGCERCRLAYPRGFVNNGLLLMGQRRYELSNGTTVVIDPLVSVRSSSLICCLRGGSRDEPERDHGVTHLLEHLLFKRTQRKSNYAIASLIDSLGSRINASTDVDSLCLYGVVPAASFSTLTEFFSEMLLDTAFTDDDLRLEKEVIRQEILEAGDDPLSSLYQRFNELCWPGNQLGSPIFGSLDSVARITRKTLQKRLKELLVGRRLVIVAAGNFDIDLFLNFVEQQFTALPQGLLPVNVQPRHGHGIEVVSKGITQSHLIIGHPWPEIRHPDYFASLLVATVLGDGMSSRLFRLLREEQGLTYDVSADVDSYLDVGSLVLSVTSERKYLPRVQQLLVNEWNNLVTAFLSKDEFDRAVNMITAQVAMQSDDIGSRAWRALESYLTYGRSLSVEELISQFQKLTLEDTNRVIRDWCATPRALFVLGGDVTDSDVSDGMKKWCGVEWT